MSRVPIRHRRSRPKPDRRALELLATSRDGCTEAIMIAHGFTVPQMVELIRAGLASAHTERVVAGGQRREVAYVRSPKLAGRRLRGAPSHDRIDPQARHSEPAIR